MKKWLYLTKGLLGLVMLGSCVRHDIYDPDEKVSIDDYFDFATTKTVQLDIDYRNEGKLLFEIYAENPLTVVDGQLLKKDDLVVLAKGFTDEQGKYRLKSSLPDGLEEVYIYTDAWGAPRLYKAAVSGNTLRADISFGSAVDLDGLLQTKTKATKGSQKIEDHFTNRLCDWDDKGVPTELYAEGKITVDGLMKNYITSTLPEGGGNGVYKTYVSDNADITLYEAASQVVINYLGGTTSAQSVFGYYCYPKEATLEQIRQAAEHACIIFPNVHARALGNNSGLAMRLKYIDETGRLVGYKFPAGVKIGFVLWNNGWVGGNNNKQEVFYSTKALNGNLNMSCTAVLGIKDQNGNKYNAIAFEDWPRGAGFVDYNDVVFSITTDPEEAVIVPPAPDPEPQLTTEVYEGLLCFEDNWPYQGDYDMNDVVVKYTSNVTSNDKNELVSVVDKFNLVWSGANYADGFGYELPISLDGVKVTLGEGITRKGQVISLFENARQELGVGELPAIAMPGMDIQEKSYSVTLKLGDTKISKDGFFPPYNSFIRINKRKTEVHLVDHAPTEEADNTFPNEADISDGIDSYFVSEYNYPFAFHLDTRMNKNMMKFNYQAEGIRIDAVYPKFRSWAASRGKEDKDWYLYPVKFSGN